MPKRATPRDPEEDLNERINLATAFYDQCEADLIHLASEPNMRPQDVKSLLRAANICHKLSVMRTFEVWDKAHSQT